MQLRVGLSCLAAICLLPGVSLATPEFERDVLPILTNQCLNCHGGLVHKNQLDLRTIEKMLKGGESGPAVKAGDPDHSLMWQKIAKDEMPKTLLKLSADEKKTLREWIAAGLPRSKHAAQVETKRGASAAPASQVAADLDRDLNKAMAEAKITPAALSSDTEFLRRAYLDLHGRLPNPEQVRGFLASSDSDKRAKLIDQLLAEPQFARHWAQVWHDQVMPLVDGKRVYAKEMLDWLAASFERNRPWDAIVKDLVAGEGSTETNPGIHYLLAHKDPEKISARSASLFLGLNLECAECHNHPHFQWKQKEDFWALAAFFSTLRTTKKGTVTVLTDAAAPGKIPQVRIPTTALIGANMAVPAAFPGNEGSADGVKAPYRNALAEWMTAPGNPYFATAGANRIWAHFFGRGLIEPIDNLHDGNAPSHAGAMAILTHEFKASKYDIKHLVRSICRTQAYQRTSRTEREAPDQEEWYGRMPVRLLRPEVLYDVFCQSLDVAEVEPPNFDPKAFRGKTPPSLREVFVNTFPQGAPPPSTEYSHGVLQILQFVNWGDFNGGGKIVPKLLEAKLPAEQIVEELYLRTLGRQPTEPERQRIAAYVAQRSEPHAAYAAVLWSLLNSSEYVFNH